MLTLRFCKQVFGRTPTPRVGDVCFLILAAVCAPTWAEAQTQCEPGQDIPCASDAVCRALDASWVCAADDSGATTPGHCAPKCTAAKPEGCSLGETCLEGASPLGELHAFCRASKFTVDLNLLDSCIYHFLEGAVPDLTGTDTCAVENRLQQVLDRDGNQFFDIYDVDRCIKDFLDEPPCDANTERCPDQQVFCRDDQECGSGLHCNTDLLRCERECGFVVDRNTSEGDTTLERECAGALQFCNYDRGECVDADLSTLTCEVDRDCPHGAYCLAGRCEPKCFRSLDCPGDNWLCNAENRCAPKPPSGTSAAAPFTPEDYSLVFAQSEVKLDSLNDRATIPVLVMNKQTKAQVLGHPEVVFGYRLELGPGRRQARECRGEEATRPSSCTLDGGQFVRLDSPFGVLSATDAPALAVSLNAAGAAQLSEGTYDTKLTAIFDNGASTSTRITFQKSSPSGEYAGRLSVYADVPDNLIGNTDLSARLWVDRGAPEVTWDALLGENNLPLAQEYRDLNRGRRVTGWLHGAGSLVFDQPTAQGTADNDIPLKGIYSESLGRMRLIAVIDLPAAHCRSDNASQCSTKPGELQAKNVFGRDIRRIVELVGPFDSARRRFEGMYRETLHGLLPSAATLSGGFILQQIMQNDEPVTLDPLLRSAAPVSFPPVAGNGNTLLSELEGVIARTCKDDQVKHYFQSRASFRDEYLAHDWTGQAGRPVLSELVTFESRVSTALEHLDDSGGALTLTDYFRGQIEFCKPGGGASCVDQSKLECGLALYRKALLSGWVELSQVGNELDNELDKTPLANKPPLFCRRGPGLSPDCPLGPELAPALTTLQEHNRFYKELTQTYSYQALNGLSDAFYTLYKAANGDALDADSAFQYKQASLVQAAQSYQEVMQVAVSSPSVSIMVKWPMREFATSGLSWIKQMHANASDRLNAVAQLVDLKRRVLQDSDAADRMFAEDLMHQEYLIQVFLALLQQRWEGESFAYAGQGSTALERGSFLLAKTNASRNPLGLHPNRVYFENSKVELSNWQALRERVLQGSQQLHGTVDTAITEMKNALHDKDSFLTTLLDQEHQIEQQLDELCGDPDPGPVDCSLTPEEREAARGCSAGGGGGECNGITFSCWDADCGQVQRSLSDDRRNLSTVACIADVEQRTIRLGAVTRPCSRGRLGSLVQERVVLDLQREHALDQFSRALRQVGRHSAHLQQVQSLNQAINTEVRNINITLGVIEGSLYALDAAKEIALQWFRGSECIVIIGFAAGTDCPQKAVSGGLSTLAIAGFAVANAALRASISALERAKEVDIRDVESRKELAQLRLGLDDMVSEVETFMQQYEILTQQIYNLDLQIEDTRYLAQAAADRYQESLGDLVDRLLGRETGSVLLRNRLIQQSDSQFQTLLLDTYKMTQAFVHRYNMAEQEHSLLNAVYQLSSVNDLDAHVQYLTDLEERYCGAEGIDCDSQHNRKVMAFSLRKNLFPNLRDLIDPTTGTVLTAGQQFHNLITTQMTRRRQRASGVRQQIELPFNIWLNKGGLTGGRDVPYLVNGEECNHMLVADRQNNSGTVAVNVIGTRLGGGQERQITYELWRGGTDHIRSCSERVSREENKVNSYTVGWSPYHQFGQRDDPPSFQTHSDGFYACKNNRQLADPAQYDAAGSCFNFFARDRSLAAPDWKLVIPFLDREQKWLSGEGMSENERPIIEDIVVYFRYNARPIVLE